MPHDPVAVEFGHAEALRIVDFFQQNARAGILRFELANERRNIVLHDVVAEDHGDALAFGKVFAELERVGDAALALLVRIVDVLEAELAAVPE